MAPITPARSWQVVDEYVAAYEAARAGGGADPADFLPPVEHPHYLDVLSELIRVDLELGWNDGLQPRLENYRDRFPALFADRQRLGEAAYEEYRLRVQAGEHALPSDYARRFGIDISAWDDEPPEVAFPELGTQWGEFRLLRELGRGTFARVYLAEQCGLADRLVALKLSTAQPLESQTLAQLQHANIVPVYSAHALGRWQGLCMPYFGATTLADVAGALRRRERLPQRGRELVETVVARRSATLPLARRAAGGRQPRDQAPEPHPAAALAPEVRLFDPLERLSYVEAILWIVARTAEGLAHAHARGIVHQDLKPANILLADDGRPMLLDFNLSTDAKRRGDVLGAQVGGTLPYMAPEQLRALEAGAPGATPQADLYALGVVLFELLTGRSPFAPLDPAGDRVAQSLASRRSDIPRLRPYNTAVTPAVEAIVRRCLAYEPAERYASADELREDIDRHLAHRPLKHAPNPSIRERAAKLARRRGRRATLVAAGVLALALIVLLAATVRARNHRAEGLAAQAAAADTRREAREIQFLFSQPDAEPAERVAAERRARELAQRYSLLESDAAATHPLWTRLSSDRQRQLASDLRGVAAFWKFDLEKRLARGEASIARRAEWTDKVERLQRTDDWLKSAGGASTPALDAAREAIVAGDLESAAERLSAITRGAPDDFSAWSLLGHCQMFLGRFREAEASFTVCRALWPDSAWPPYHRGQARYRARDFRGALADFDVAIAQRPRWPDARYQRALAHLGLRQPAAALADLDAAAKSGELPPLRVHCLRARIHQELGKPDEAERDLARALTYADSDDKVGLVSRGIARLQMRRDARGALSDFEAALVLDPGYRAALENKAHVLSERLGRPAEAIDVLDRIIEQYPGYVPALGGRGVLLARGGQRSKAHADADRALQLDDGGMTLYQVAGIYALTSRLDADDPTTRDGSTHDRQRALALLRQALQQGYGYDLLARDPDLDPLRDWNEFQRLAQAAAAVHRPAGARAAND